jgi:hypothetical protein
VGCGRLRRASCGLKNEVIWVMIQRVEISRLNLLNSYYLYQVYVQSIYTNRNQTSALERSVGSAMIGRSEPARRPTWSS